jgi:hypothetical protein
MTLGHPDDRLLSELRQLTTLTPDPDRAALVRARCRAELASRAARQTPSTADHRAMSRRLATVGVLTVCALYLASLVSVVVELSSLALP